MTYEANRPRYDVTRDEWSQRTGPNTWRVWRNGTMPGDHARWTAEAKAELAREDVAEAQARGGRERI